MTLASAESLLSQEAYQNVYHEVADVVMRVLENEQRDALGEDDREYIETRVPSLVEMYVAKPRRFRMGDRVVVRLGGDRPWAAATVVGVNVDDQSGSGQVLPYVAKVDAPNARLVTVVSDKDSVCRAEVCFGLKSDGLWFTVFAQPHAPQKAKRFELGARVAVAVEGEARGETRWVHGTVSEVGHSFEADARNLMAESNDEWDGVTGAKATVPYRVRLNDSDKDAVLVHRDEHWLIRDADLQPAGPRQGADGTRHLARMVRRPVPGGAPGAWHAVDHQTCRVRACGPPDPSDDDA